MAWPRQRYPMRLPQPLRRARTVDNSTLGKRTCRPTFAPPYAFAEYQATR